jgi:autotransporter adhesin
LATGSQAIGVNSRAGGGGVALGDNADAGGTALSQAQNISVGTAIGFGAVVLQSGGVALGSGSRASTAAGVAGFVPGSATAQQDAAIKATTSTQAAVSVGDAANGQYRQITGVAAGTADSDAANVAQLKAASSAVTASSAQYATNPDGTTNYSHMTLGNGQAPNGTRLSNVAPGILPTDAVNMSQLREVQTSVGNVAKIAYSGIAMAGAMAGLPQVEPGKQFSIGLGVGNYSGYSAMAIGGSARINENVIIKFGLGKSSGNKAMVNGGIGYSW